MKKLLQNKIFIFLLILVFSCKNEEFSVTIDSITLFSSQESKGELLKGSNFYFDKKGELITSIIYFSDDISSLHYEMKIINSKRQIVYFCEYKDGDIIKEYDSFAFDKISKDNGIFLHKNYCISCHSASENGIGKSIFELSKNKNTSLSNSNIYHKSLPEFTEKQMLSLIKYINNPTTD